MRASDKEIVSSLLRTLKKGLKVSDRFANVVHESSLPGAIKRKVQLYAAHDKRISVPRLIEDLKGVKVACQTGGNPDPGFRFGTKTLSPTEPKIYQIPTIVIPLNAGAQTRARFALSSSPKSPSSPSPYVLLGSGSYGSVYEVQMGDKSIAIKEIIGHKGLINHTKGVMNIMQQCKKGSEGNVVGTTFLKPSSCVSNDAKTNEDKLCYEMLVCTKLQPGHEYDINSLTKTLQEFKSMTRIQKQIVVHGDLKDGNIMILNKGQDNWKYLFTDIDGLMFFDETGIPVNDTLNIISTPTYMFPMYYWLIMEYVGQKGQKRNNQQSQQKSAITLPTVTQQIWDTAFNDCQKLMHVAGCSGSHISLIYAFYQSLKCMYSRKTNQQIIMDILLTFSNKMGHLGKPRASKHLKTIIVSCGMGWR